ncbi:MAG: anaerobic ribonucleoside-triphosphate reductase activating protein [Rikenellaceae bacterium]
MLKFTETKIVFREIPDHITLAINISGCPCKCEGCHSSYLADDIGEELNEEALNRILSRYDSASCISFMGGDAEPEEVSRLAEYIKSSAPNIMTAWYSGRDELSSSIELSHFDYIKIGSYQPSRGALDDPNTNQRLYKIEKGGEMVDITKRIL